MSESKLCYAIHTLTDELKTKLRAETHHYCGIFTKYLFAALPEKVYIDQEAYTVNKNKRILMVSYDGKLNLWQCAPTFTSSKSYPVETCITDSFGNLVSLTTVRSDNLYAIASFDGVSGKFETKHNWQVVSGNKGIVYGNKTFESREELWNYLEGRSLGSQMELQAILVKANVPRIILFDLISGLEISHSYIRGDFDVVVGENYL